jgi:hypothetical protein
MTSATDPRQQFEKDLSSQYGLVGSTVYRKKDNYAFSQPQPFLSEVGAKDFNGLKFDTSYNPASFQAPQAPQAPAASPSPTPSQPTPAPASSVPVTPGGTPQDNDSFLREIANRYFSSFTPSPQELDARKTYENLIASRDLGIADIKDQPIAMKFISGQAKAVEDRALPLIDLAQKNLGYYQQDRQTNTQAQGARLQFEEGLADRAYDRSQTALQQQKADEKQAYERNLQEQATARELTDTARQFALANNVTKPFYTLDGRTIIRTSDGKAYSTEADWRADGGKPELVQQVSQQVKPIEVSPGASLVNPNTGQVISTAPVKPTSSGSSGGGVTPRGPAGTLSARSQAVYNNPALLSSYTPTEQGKILDEIAASGQPMDQFGLNKVTAGQRDQVDKLDSLLREADNAKSLLDFGLNTGIVSSAIGKGKALFGGAQEFTQYRSSVDNLSSILLQARSGAAVTPEEYERIKGFIPRPTDDEKTAQTKIARFKEELTKARENYVKRASQTTQQLVKSTQPTAAKSNDPLGIR